MSDKLDTEAYQAEMRKQRARLQRLEGGGEGDEPEDKPRRVTNAEVLRAFLVQMQNRGGEHSTIRLARNAKGDTQIEVSVRTGESPEVETVEDAAAKAREVYEALRMLYPMAGPSE
jgi:hypothetical protein